MCRADLHGSTHEAMHQFDISDLNNLWKMCCFMDCLLCMYLCMNINKGSKSKAYFINLIQSFLYCLKWPYYAYCLFILILCASTT